MCIISVDIPEAVRQNTGMDTAATSDFACQTVAVAYFLRLHQPLADCARIARMSIPDFQELLKSSGIGADAIHLLSDLHEGYRSGEEREGGIRPIRFAHTAFKRERDTGTVLPSHSNQSPEGLPRRASERFLPPHSGTAVRK